MYGVIEPEEGYQRKFILVLHLLCCLLEAGQHGTLAAGQVLTGVAVLTDFRKHFLHDNKLVRYEGEVGGKVKGSAVTLNVQLSTVEGKQVTQHGIVLFIDRGQNTLGLSILFQDTLLDNFINGGRRQGQSGLETGLDTGEFIGADLDDFINGFLAGANNPNLTGALAANFLGQRLQIQQHVGIGAHVLTNFVNHKQQPEVLGLGIYIILNVANQLRNGQLGSGLVIEPLLGIVLTHVQDFHQGGDDKLAVEGKCAAHLQPGLAFLLLEDAAELIGLTALLNVVFQHCHLEVLTVKAQVVVEHLGKDTQHSGLVLVDRTLNVNIEKDCLSLAPGGTVNLHKGCRVILKLLAEHLDSGGIRHSLVLQNVGQHFQEVRFTTSEKTGNPHTDIRCGHIERIAIVVKEGREMLSQLFCNDVLFYFLFDYVMCILVNLDDAVDLTVNVIMEHILYSHGCPPQISLNAR